MARSRTPVDKVERALRRQHRRHSALRRMQRQCPTVGRWAQ